MNQSQCMNYKKNVVGVNYLHSLNVSLLIPIKSVILPSIPGYFQQAAAAGRWKGQENVNSEISPANRKWKVHPKVYKRLNCFFLYWSSTYPPNQVCEMQMQVNVGVLSCRSPQIAPRHDPELRQEVLAALSLLISPPPVFMAAFQ